MSLKNKLNRLKGHMNGQQTSFKSEAEVPNVSIEIPFLEEWEKENVKAYYFDGQYCLIREVRYSLDYQHGTYKFRDFIRAVEAWNQSEIHHPLSAFGHKPGELFFFDTETTGLGGGVGNTIFLLGYASIKGEEVVVRQHILPHPGAEVPLYQSFLENIDYRTLVTYNGKSFDWPQVKTRHTLVRDSVPKLPPFGHFDLYHAARRLWKHKLERMKLAIVEKEVLGIERVNDVPGYLAPMIYFDFIESKKPEGMLGMLKHNEIDILSLISLYTHLSFQLLQLDGDQTRKEAFEIGRWYGALGESETSESMYQVLAEGADEESFKSKLELGRRKKRESIWDEALTLFLEASSCHLPEVRIEALTEAAKIFEHKNKNFQEALRCCSQISQELDSLKHQNKKIIEKLEKALNKRKSRLEMKVKKLPIDRG